MLEVGGVSVNGSSCFRPGSVPYMPRKESGIGTDNMYNCYDEMTTGKAVVICDAIGVSIPDIFGNNDCFYPPPCDILVK